MSNIASPNKYDKKLQSVETKQQKIWNKSCLSLLY